MGKGEVLESIRELKKRRSYVDGGEVLESIRDGQIHPIHHSRPFLHIATNPASMQTIHSSSSFNS
jgi:hypothetical protein